MAVSFLVPKHADLARFDALSDPLDIPAYYQAQILLVRALVVAAHVGLGLALGGLTSAVWRGWDRALRRSPALWLRWLRTLGTVAALEAWLLAVSLVRYPDSFVFWLYERGGVLAGLQTSLTENLSSRGLLEAGACLLLPWVALPSMVLRRRRELQLRPSRPLAAAVASLLLVACALWVGRSPAAVPTPHTGQPPRRPNILVLCVESLRADRVSERKEVTPNIQELVRDGVRFDGFHCSSPRTTQAMTSQLTGHWPHGHGFRHMFPTPEQRAGIGVTLPRVLREAGYATIAMADDAYGPLAQFDYGFQRHPPGLGGTASVLTRSYLLRRRLALLPLTTTDAVHDMIPALGSDWHANDPAHQADDLIQLLEAQTGSEPFFIYAFFSSPHLPYSPPEPWYRRFTSADYSGPNRYGYSWRIADVEWDRRQLRGLYDGAVAAADHAIGRVLDALERQGLDDRTIVVVLGDHGELLHEAFRGYGHGDHLHGEEQLTSALVIQDPVHAFTSRVVPGIVRDVDLAPTLATLARVEFPGGDGVDLLPLLRGEQADMDLPAFCESGYAWERGALEARLQIPFPRYPGFLSFRDGSLVLAPELVELNQVVKERSICRGRYKLIYKPTVAGARYELYDTVADPEERRDVSGRLPRVTRRLREELVEWMCEDGSVVRPDGLVVPRLETTVPAH